MSKPERPGWLTAIVAIAIIMGVFGLLMGIGGLGSTLFWKQTQAVVRPAQNPNLNPALEKELDEFQQEMQAVTDRYRVPLVLTSLFRMVVAGMLVYGGIQALSFNSRGRKVLLAAFAAGLVFEAVFRVLKSIIDIEIDAAMNVYFERLVSTVPQRGPPDVLLSIMRTAVVVGYAMQYVVTFAKITFYVVGLVYLRRPLIAALFSNGSRSSH